MLKAWTITHFLSLRANPYDRSCHFKSGFYVNEQRAPLVRRSSRSGRECKSRSANQEGKTHLKGQKKKPNRGELLKRMTRRLAVNVGGRCGHPQSNLLQIFNLREKCSVFVSISRAIIKIPSFYQSVQLSRQT